MGQKNRVMAQKHLLAKKQRQQDICANNRHMMSCTERVNDLPASVLFQKEHKNFYALYKTVGTHF